MNTLTWLHISDLHFRTSATYDTNVVLKALLEDVAKARTSQGLRPDFVFVTGDIAFSGQPAEYALARRFFDDLLRTTRLDKDHLFLVPGNHDVDRSLISTLAQGAGEMLSSRKQVNDILATPDDRRLMFARFEGYRSFVNDYLAGHLTFDDQSCSYVHTLGWAGLRVAILGLNSAWLARGGDGDYGRLVLGERQVRQALDEAEDSALKIALLHHPFDWLRQFDRDDAEAMLLDRCDFVLHGHMHTTAAAQLTSPDGAATVLACGACYETRQYRNGYNLVRLDFSRGQGTVFLRAWSDQRGGFWTRDVMTYRNVDNGEYAFRLADRFVPAVGPAPTSRPAPVSGRTALAGGLRVADPQKAPTGEIRELVRGVFNPKSLARFCEEHPVFRDLRHSFPSGGSLEDMIDVVFEFCRTRDRWEDLLDALADRSPSIYNRTAAQLGWPQVDEVTQHVQPIRAEPPTAPSEEPRPRPQPVPAPAYDDVEIHVVGGPTEGYTVTIQTSLTGASTGTFRPTWTPDDLQRWLFELEEDSVEREDAAKIGKLLFHALFSGYVRDRYVEAVGKAKTGLRLRLWFDAPELQTLPWELLYDAERDEFLALSGRARVTRYLSVPEGTPPLAVEPPLRMLIASAEPLDQRQLAVEAEVAAVKEALAAQAAQGQVEIHELAHAQRMTLRDALREFNPHVLHFIGHGGVDAGVGVLILEDEDSHSRPLSSTTLRTMLRRTDVRLAVLNACLTAWGDISPHQRQALLGVGPALVRAGLGAVVAMQFSQRDEAAHLFAQDFYRNLARLEPVDQAVSRAREALMVELGEDHRDWATPVLFLRALDGVIFAPTAGRVGNSHPHNSPNRTATERTLEKARRNLAVLEEQAAGYTSLTIPAHLAIELEDKRREVAELEARLQ